MARRRAADYEDKRQRLLTEAARLFAEQGFPRTTIEALARACDASKSWLYHYYPSKEALLYDLLRAHVLELLRAADEAELEGGSPAEQLRTLVRSLMGIYVRSADKHVVLLNDLQVLPEEQQREIVGLERRLVDRFGAILAALAPAAVRDRARGRALTMALLGMINFTYTWFDPDGPVGPQAYADLATDLFLGGIQGVAREGTG
ncbi:MAG: TetR/AcrR family transcriptional regulator [Sandaracinaceae bacterium]